MNYQQMLVEEIHTVTAATIGEDGHPVTRAIDMMMYDDRGLYFLTARGKAFYAQLTEQNYVALSGVDGKKAISVRGTVRCIGSEKRDAIFRLNPYMEQIYPGNTKEVLDVFCLCEGQGDFFDISNPGHVVRDHFAVGGTEEHRFGYVAGDGCVACHLCFQVCPQKCINALVKPVEIDQNRCLHCGRCVTRCPMDVITWQEL